ncbi:MAG: type 1 glutamine amidotransferase [Candidatus Goldbacteria bacterium]|nr:type 1 glutamine amidotransferase [Candidatus Goldiibacteriota bacterium]
MNIHIIMHVPFEGPGTIEPWAKARDHNLTYTRVYENEKFPDMDAFDMLIIMGGPMSVNDIDKYAWLSGEKGFISMAVSSCKKVLGICLGAQILAECLGGKVYPNREKEIGWHNTYLTEAGRNMKIFEGIPHEFSAFHWHGETFEVPAGCERIAYSDACENQGFVFGNEIAAFQFHLECTEESVKGLYSMCEDEIVPGKYVRTFDTVMEKKNRFAFINEQMIKFMDNFTR